MPGSLGAEELPVENSLQQFPVPPPVNQTLFHPWTAHVAALLRTGGQGECYGGPGVCVWQGPATHTQRPCFVLTEKVPELWPLL